MKIYAKDILKKYAQNPLDPTPKLRPAKEPVTEPEKKRDSGEKKTETLDGDEDDSARFDKEKTVRDLSNELIENYFNDDKITEISHKLQLIIQGIFFGERDKHTFSDKMMKLFSDWLNATTSIKANLLALDILSTPRVPPTTPSTTPSTAPSVTPKIDVVKT